MVHCCQYLGLVGEAVILCQFVPNGILLNSAIRLIRGLPVFPCSDGLHMVQQSPQLSDLTSSCSTACPSPAASATIGSGAISSIGLSLPSMQSGPPTGTSLSGGSGSGPAMANSTGILATCNETNGEVTCSNTPIGSSYLLSPVAASTV
ncbi:unnamed protein product, partial [Protopolystoma xenopodis]